MTQHIITVFRSRLADGIDVDYAVVAKRMSELAIAMPGYVEHKTFVADDGERLTLATFTNRETHEAWRTHPEHIAAQHAGRDRFYAEYSLTVAEVHHHREFRRP